MAFDLKTRGKFSIAQVERMELHFADKCELKNLTFLGISSAPDGSDMTLYSKEDFAKDNGNI